MINEYYEVCFNGSSGYDPARREAVAKKLVNGAKRKATVLGVDVEILLAKVPGTVSMLDERRRALKVKELSFNSFYEFSIELLDIICMENNITEIDYDKYAYMIQPFYKGGKYEKTLNEQVDTTLFNESFIVFEVDSIKDSKELFPIVTLIIMDVFLQKMRLKKNRKVLVMTDVDCKKIFTINRLENKEGRSFFKEVFIRRGMTSGVYGVEESKECYMTYTTERAEKEALKLYKRELGCSHQEAIEAYCRDWSLSGIDKPLPFAQKVNQVGRVLNLKIK